MVSCTFFSLPAPMMLLRAFVADLGTVSKPRFKGYGGGVSRALSLEW